MCVCVLGACFFCVWSLYLGACVMCVCVFVFVCVCVVCVRVLGACMCVGVCVVYLCLVTVRSDINCSLSTVITTVD